MSETLVETNSPELPPEPNAGVDSSVAGAITAPTATDWLIDDAEPEPHALDAEPTFDTLNNPEIPHAAEDMAAVILHETVDVDSAIIDRMPSYTRDGFLPSQTKIIDLLGSIVEFNGFPKLSCLREEESPEINADEVYISLDGETPSDQVLKDEFLAKLAGDREFWWDDLATERDGVQISRVTEIVTTDSKQGTDSKVDIIEILPEADQLTEQELITIKDTVEFIDQFTGGAMSQEEFINNIVFLSNSGDQSKIAVAENGSTRVFIDQIRAIAESLNEDTQTVLATILTHEILGHQAERYLTGSTGEYFKQFFEYSDTMVKREGHKNVHAAITPRANPDIETSPVREYGGTNSAEDLATTSELMTKFNGESGVLSHPDFIVDQDKYREGLFVDFLSKVASRSQAEVNDKWGVGSPISYEIDKNGELKVTASRKTEIVGQINPNQYIKSVVEKVASKKRGKEYIYRAKSVG